MVLAVVWLALGTPARRAERSALVKHRGGRTARERSAWRLPARDRALAPGGSLLILAAASLSEIVLDTAASTNSDVGFAAQPGLVGGGMGVVGIVALVVGRLGGVSFAQAATTSQNALWVAGAGILLRIGVLAPTHSVSGV